MPLTTDTRRSIIDVARVLDMLFFFLFGISFTNILIHRTAGKGGGYLFNSSLPLPPDSQAFRH